MSAASSLFDTAEGRRPREADAAGWRRWGPCLGERQWGTVREDYGSDDDAWRDLPHDHARSRAYRRGEGGIAGFCDAHQHWCLSLGLWNGADPIMKERLFGLANEEGNHGEDVKEVWWTRDAAPTQSHQRMVYRYPQAPFPYADVEVAYARQTPDDILMRVGIVNRGPEAAPLPVLPQRTARNVWSWGDDDGREKPHLSPEPGGGGARAVHPGFRPRRLPALRKIRLLFCENEPNRRRLYGAGPGGAFEDAISDHLVGGGAKLLPGDEWALGDDDPPIHAFAALRVERMDEASTGVGDRAFLERIFHKLMIDFTWRVNRTDGARRGQALPVAQP